MQFLLVNALTKMARLAVIMDIFVSNYINHPLYIEVIGIPSYYVYSISI